MIKRILVPLDGSQAAESVLPYVERIATATNARVLLLAAVDRPRDWGEDTGGDLKGERHEAESYLRSLQVRLTSATGSDVECEVVSSEPAAAILDASERQHPDLIAMTTHGRSGVARWVLGSVAAKLLHATHGAVLAGGLASAYVGFIRPRQMRWGATSDEATRVLPYDHLVRDPTWSSTRVITVEATPEQIWPWLVQVGWGRAGYYGYDWVDNGGKPSAWEILPEHQHLEVGTKFPMSPWTAMYCRDFEEPRWMLLRMGKDDGGASDIGSFLYYLDPIDDRHTRLMIRMRDKYRWFNPSVLAMQLAVDVGDIFFQWKHLEGVKARAERMATLDAASTSRQRYKVAP